MDMRYPLTGSEVKEVELFAICSEDSFMPLWPSLILLHCSSVILDPFFITLSFCFRYDKGYAGREDDYSFFANGSSSLHCEGIPSK
jgi:hypothetical protein